MCMYIPYTMVFSQIVKYLTRLDESDCDQTFFHALKKMINCLTMKTIVFCQVDIFYQSIEY